NGLYSVSSRYRLAQSLQTISPTKSGRSLLDSHVWAKLWGSPIQPKLKFFAWKIFNNILPLHDTLAARPIKILTTCSVCHTSVETLQHLLDGCTVAT
ncbi:hypothetical protein LINGRAHAP2_LOCUS1935, partial [Linum grandiflorum]